MSPRLWLLLGLAAVARIVYVFLAPASDPTFARPMLDGAYYLSWASSLGEGTFAGVYYLGPLYPWFLRLSGLTTPGSLLLALVQESMTLAAAAGIGWLAWRETRSELGALVGFGLAAFYHPAVFFASRPLSEPLGIFLLVAALLLATIARDDDRPLVGLGSGLLSGLAALARPSFLAVPVLWGAFAAISRRPKLAGMLLLGAAAAIGPATIRNLAVSGHLVPVSANAGIVLWLGNAPGAEGILAPGGEFSGSLATQQQEATEAASRAIGRRLDPVEADAYWRGRAIGARLDDLAGTSGLLLRRLGLTVDNAEHGLDYAPALDRNPAAIAFPVPFAVIAALAAAGIACGGWRKSPMLWGAILATAATPLLFYVSSRHRLPLALLLCVPAGWALPALAEVSAMRRRVAIAVAIAVGAVSLLWPSGKLLRAEEAGALANVAVARKDAGDLPGAEADLRRALSLDPTSAAASFNLGVVLEKRGDTEGAEGAYRAALASDPGQAEAAGNLAGILVRSGRSRDAIPLLRGVLERRPGNAVCWNNLVTAYAAAGDAEGARGAAREAAATGVTLNPELLRAIGAEESSGT